MRYEEVKELIQIFEKTDLNDMEVTLGDARVRLNRGSVSPWAAAPVGPAGMLQMPAPLPAVQNAAPPVAEAEKPEKQAEAVSSEVTEENAGGKVIKAPIVGTFYQSSAPDKPPFVQVGDEVAKGDVVCIIEAMKFMNEVNAKVSGTVAEILVKDGEFVEYGQELFRLK